ncbi:MAG: Helicase associated domain protein [Methylococcaceae bacterium]
MSSFYHLFNSLSADSNKKGEQFERITKWFLENDPEWKSKIDKVWLWNDYPQKWARDRGIDLVCLFKDGTHWAVQSKCYHPDYSLKKADIDSFLSESNRKEISGRILVATTNQLGDGAAQVIKAQEKPTVCVLLAHLEDSNIEFPADPENLTQVKQREKPTPEPHQTEAINEVVQGLATDDKGQLIMCCGTGKTFTSLWIKEALESQNTLVLLPSLGLLSQTLKEWCFAKNEEFSFLCVCSDASVSKEDDEVISHTLDLGFPVTTLHEDIEKFLLTSGNKVIFSTYQSSLQIAKAQENPDIPAFDIVFADEAHRCAGKVSNDFSCVLDEEKIRARKRLFMTATPRVFSTAVKIAAEGRGVEIACMDDEQVFGRVLHRLNFGTAIERKLLTDYEVIIVGVDNPMIKAWIDQREFLQTDTGIEADAQTFAVYIGLMKVMRDRDLKRVISFHGRVKRAQEFASGFLNVFNWVDAEHKPSGVMVTDYVSGIMNAGKRSTKIKQLKTLYGAERGLLANARCLSEGVDVPALDGVAFIDPRKSQVDIVQAVGRAIRKNKDKKLGFIIIPVFIGDSDNPQTELENSRYKPIWDVLNALKSHDDVLAEELDNFRTSLGRNNGGSGGGFSKITIDLPRTVGNEFVAALNARIVEVTTISWLFWYGLLLDYVEEYGHARVQRTHTQLKYNGYSLGKWISHQRTNKNKLNFEKIKQLESLPQWSWDVFEDQWNEGFEYLKRYVEEHNHSRVNNVFKYKDFNLGSWIGTQRQTKDKLDIQKIKLLESLPQWSWDVLEDEWNEFFSALKKYIRKYGHLIAPRDLKYEGYYLGTWIKQQRMNKDKLSPERKALLKSLPQWSWNPFEDQWNKGFEYLKKYVEERGDAKVLLRFKYEDFNLGVWVQTQRKGKNKLSLERINLLEKLPQWTWDAIEDQWNEGFKYLKKYAEGYSHAKVPLRFKYDGYFLGQWVATQRRGKDKLSSEKINLLEALPQWSWNALEDKWNEGFEYLKKYTEEQAYSNVPAQLMYENYSLGQWVGTQRRSKKNNKLDLERIKKLESIPQWSWGCKTE